MGTSLYISFVILFVWLENQKTKKMHQYTWRYPFHTNYHSRWLKGLMSIVNWRKTYIVNASNAFQMLISSSVLRWQLKLQKWWIIIQLPITCIMHGLWYLLSFFFSSRNWGFIEPLASPSYEIMELDPIQIHFVGFSHFNYLLYIVQ